MKDAATGPIPLGLALLPVVVLLVAFAGAGLVLDVGAAGLLAAMLAAAATATVVATTRGATWADVERSMGEKLAAALPVVLILLAIGMLIGTWMLAGTIPLLVAWGIELIDPRFFVLTAFLVTAVMSLGTGTSWGSAGTLGVALMGAAGAVGAPLAATAGAVVSGSYLGDKMSPLSDSTNICAIGAGADLYAHIRHMLYTATPSALACVAVYALLPTGAGGAVPGAARRVLGELDAGFRLDLWALVPVVVVVVGIARRLPAVVALAASSLAALLVGVLRQGASMADALSAAVGGYRAEMVGGTLASAPSADLVRLVERGGIESMAPTLVLVLAAFLLTAAMDVSGALDRLLAALLGTVTSVFGLVAATMAAGATMIALTSHGGVTSLVVGGLFQDAYRDRGLAPVNLSRSLEDSVTIVEPLLPWTVSGLYMATTLGVGTVDLAPWAVFCYGGPFFSLLLAALHRWSGRGIRRIEDATSRAPETGSRHDLQGLVD